LAGLLASATVYLVIEEFSIVYVAVADVYYQILPTNYWLHALARDWRQTERQTNGHCHLPKTPFTLQYIGQCLIEN